MKKSTKQSPFLRAVKKFFLSAFVVVTFIGYALTHRGDANTATPVAGALPTQPTNPVPAAELPNNVAAPTTAPRSATAVPAPSATPVVPPTNPAPQVASNGLKDGTYTGSTVDVDWGLVQVQASIQNGQITDVQFLQFPADRRTSRRINSFAVPRLQQEAVQSQSANVDIITGATLTSEGFQMSLQAALDQAKGGI